MKLTKTQIRAILLKYDSKNVGAKMLKKLTELTPYEIGRSLLATKMSGQKIVNLETKKIN